MAQDSNIKQTGLTVREQLDALELEEKLAAKKRLAEEAEANRISRESRLKSIAEGQERKKAEQRNCLHRKQRGESAIGGQKTHRGTFIFVCQFCQAEFDITTLPAGHGHIMEQVGGPM